MAIPKISELYNPILQFLSENGKSHISTIRNEIARSFYVQEDEVLDRNNKRYSLYESRVNQACWNLCYAGLIERTFIGFYTLSGSGEEAVDKDDFVDRDYLWEIPSFREHIISQRDEPGIQSSASLSTEAEEVHNRRNDHAVITVKPRPEFVLIEQPTIAQIVKLKRQDTRFANMIASGCYLYEDGSIKEVPQEVMMHDMPYEEFKATNLIHGVDNSAILLYQDANGSGKIVSAPPKSISGYHRNPKAPDKWANPIPWVTSNGAKLYSDVKDMLDYIGKNPDFNKCFEHLIKDVYKIKVTDLCKLSGVDAKKIQRMMNNPSVSVKVTELAAIFWVLKVPAQIVEAMIDLAGFSPKSPKYQPYVVICTLTVYSTYEEVNDLCKQEGLVEIFPQSLKGRVS